MEGIGFIGIGEMGFPMAKNLIDDGYQLYICDIVKEPLIELEKHGAKICDSPKTVANSSKTIIVMVRTTEEAVSVITGENGILEGADSGSIILLMSTIDPSVTQRLAKEAIEKGVHLLDAPVSGARQGAEARTLTIMIGGPEEIYENVKPILEAMGKNLFYLGSSGMGETAKLINNLLLLVNMNTGYEAMALGKKAGVKLDVLQDLIKVSTGGSWIMQNWDLVTSWKDNYVEGGTMDLIYKDINLALKLGEDLKVPLCLSSLAKQLGRYQ